MANKFTYRAAIVIIIIGLLALSYKSLGQTTLQFKFSPLGMHFFNEPNKSNFENRIDSNSNFVFEPCVILGVETYLVSDILCFRGNLGGLSDAVSKPGLFLQLGLKVRLFQVYRNSLSIGVGFMGYGHECWNTLPNYVEQKGWAPNGKWEYSIGYLADLEYAIFLNDKSDLMFNISYGYQKKTFNFSVGYRYWLSSIIKHPIKCGSCPFTKTKHWNK